MGFETPTPPEVQNTPKPIEGPKPDGETAGIGQRTRERMLTFFEFNKLKLREYFGKIDEGQLQTLLELEFEQAKKDTPSIPEVFDPEAELGKLKTLPREQKREALTDFKSKLACQREAWATCRTFLRRKIEANHDVEKQDLMDWVTTFSDEYGFTDEQRQTAEEIIDDYYENRQRVKEIREQYPDDIELVNSIMGMGFDAGEKIAVSTGPMTIDISCDGFNSGRLYERNPDVTVKFKHAGFTSVAYHDGQQIPYIVINTDMREVTVPHEYQHRENHLFAQRFDIKQNESWNLWHQYQDEQDPDTKRALLESCLRVERETALTKTKDELIAMKKDGDKYKYDIWFKQDDSPYDYLSEIRDREDSDLYKEYSQRLLVDEYRIIIENAVYAFDQLRKGKYSTDQTIALLTDKPLNQWPKTVRRLLQQKEERQ
jgi:hypothetical protein